MRDTIRRGGENTRARRTRRRAMALETTRIGARKRKPIGIKRIPIDLAKIIADLAGARVGVLELQNRLRDLARHRAHLDRAAVVGREVGLI